MNSPTNLDLFKVAEVELTYRSKPDQRNAPVITQSQMAHRILIDNWDMNRIELVEEFKILLLDKRYACLGISNIASGGYASVTVDPKLIFATALKSKASNLILAHNHPSGTLKQSVEDEAITERLVMAGTLLGIQVVDHLIMTKDSYCSFADHLNMPQYNKSKFSQLFPT